MSRLTDAIKLIGEEKANKFAEADPTKTNKYLKWMANQSTTSGYSDDDIIDIMQTFHRRKDALTNTDIYKYEDISVLEEEISGLGASKAERKDIGNLIAGKDYIKFKSDDKLYRLYMPLNFKASKCLGQGTNWCISINENTWKSYNKNHAIFVAIDGETEAKAAIVTSNSKYENIGVWDKRDYKYDMSSIGNNVKKQIKDIVARMSKLKGVTVKFDQEGDKPIIGSYSGETLEDIGFTKEFIEEHNLWNYFSKSLDLKLISSFLPELKEHFKDLKYNSKFSGEFSILIFSDKPDIVLKVLEDKVIKSSDQVNSIIKEAIKDLSEEKIKQLFEKMKENNKFILVGIDKSYAKYINKVTQLTLAKKLIKTAGVNAIKSVWDLYGEKGRPRYRRYYPYTEINSKSPITSIIDKLSFDYDTAIELRDDKECPAKFKKHIIEVIDKIEAQRKVELAKQARKEIVSYLLEKDPNATKLAETIESMLAA